MKNYSRELKSAFRKMGFSARITQGTLRLRTPVAGYRAVGILSLGGILLFSWLGFTQWRTEGTLPVIYMAISGILLICALVLLFGIRGEYYIINRQLKTIRNVWDKEQLAKKYDYPPVLTIEDMEKNGRYRMSYLCFKKGTGIIDTVSFNRRKFNGTRPEELLRVFTLWLTKGQVDLPELSYNPAPLKTD